MTLSWHKLGLVYCAAGELAWSRTHAYCPTPILRDGSSSIRIFCAFLDDLQIGRCGWVDVDLKLPTRVLEVSPVPVLDVGRPGTFDEHGVTPLSATSLPDGTIRLYYAGWQRGVDVRYSIFTGIAESRDGGASFERISEAPALDRSDGELHMRTGGLVLPSGDGWEMWYAGGSGWVGSGNEARPRYSLRHVQSPDGVTWPDHGEVCLEPTADELGFGRPCILRDVGRLRMWFGRRSLDGHYEFGYASSSDGLRWDRDDSAAGLERGPAGAWDSDMVGLSSLIETDAGTYLFYNGNAYGKTGFGVAVASGE